MNKADKIGWISVIAIFTVLFVVMGIILYQKQLESDKYWEVIDQRGEYKEYHNVTGILSDVKYLENYTTVLYFESGEVIYLSEWYHGFVIGEQLTINYFTTYYGYNYLVWDMEKQNP